MKNKYLKSVVPLLFFCAMSAWMEVAAQDDSSHGMVSIRVTATGFKNTNGQAILNIFKTSEGFPGDFSKAYKSIRERIIGNSIIFNVEIPGGVYAFGCVHDENNNNAMDKNIIGIPKEGGGLSNYKEKGYPSFNKAKMRIDESRSLTININYL